MIKLISFYILLSISFSGHAQSTIEGKSYRGVLSTSCKRLADGGCTINEYGELFFEKDSLKVKRYTKEYCSPEKHADQFNSGTPPKEQKYEYAIKNNEVIVKGFEYSPLKILKTDLSFENSEIKKEIRFAILKE